MLDFLRRSATSLFAWFILGILALVFGLSFGLPSDSLNFGSKALARVHGQPIREEDFRYQLGLMGRVLRIPSDPNVQQMLGVREEVFDAIVERMVLAHEAEQLGLGATTWDAEEATLKGRVILLGDTYDWIGDGKFNYDIFTKAFLASLQLTEPRYLEIQRQEILAQTLRDTLISSISLPEERLRQEYEQSANQLSLRYARFEPAAFAELVDVSEDEVERHVAAHRDELAKLFASQGARFSKLPKQVHLRLIEIARPTDPAARAKARATIDALRRQIVQGADFRSVARSNSQHAATARSGGDYGWVSVDGTGSGLDPVIDARASTLEPETVSEVLVAEQAFYLIRIEGRREGDVAEADALRELAAEAVKRERGKDLARQAADESLLELKSGKTLSDLFRAPAALDAGSASGIETLPLGGDANANASSDARKPELRTTGLFGKNGPIPGLGAAPELLEAAWQADPKKDAIERIFEVGEGFVVAGIERKETADDEGFKAQRAAIFARLATDKAERVGAQFAMRRCLEAKARGDISVDEEALARLFVYDTKGETPPDKRPFSVCDRVGHRGGLLRAGTFMTGGGEPQ